jgi:hypothetical protein
MYINDKRYGYWESYQFNGKLAFKGYFINGEPYGYHEDSINKTYYYAK